MKMLKSNGIANKENVIPIQNAKIKWNSYINWAALDCFTFYYPAEPQSRSDKRVSIGTAYKIIFSELFIGATHKRNKSMINILYLLEKRLIWQYKEHAARELLDN